MAGARRSTSLGIDKQRPGGGSNEGHEDLEIGGFIAWRRALIVFGVVAICMDHAPSTVRDSLRDEQVFFSTAADEDAATDKYASEWYGEQVTSASRRVPSRMSCASTSSSAPEA